MARYVALRGVKCVIVLGRADGKDGLIQREEASGRWRWENVCGSGPASWEKRARPDRALVLIQWERHKNWAEIVRIPRMAACSKVPVVPGVKNYRYKIVEEPLPPTSYGGSADDCTGLAKSSMQALQVRLHEGNIMP